MSHQVNAEKIEALFKYYSEPQFKLNWPSIFVLPSSLQSWWQTFSANWQLFLQSVWQDGQLIGIAPLIRSGDTVQLLGSADICDYLDFIIVPGKEELFFSILLPDLKKQGVSLCELHAQRPDAAVFKGLLASDSSADFPVQFTPEDSSFELELSVSWELYLAQLKKKQRHEVRRKIRRLENESAAYSYQVIKEPVEVQQFMPEFMELFRQNPEKSDFLTDSIIEYFYRMVSRLSETGMTHFGKLIIDNQVAAAVLYFIYHNRVYLYNSGYSFEFSELSAGLLSKVFCIRENIERGLDVFDFLKGTEVYKMRLGGREIPIYSVSISL